MKKESDYKNKIKACFFAVITFVLFFIFPITNAYCIDGEKFIKMLTPWSGPIAIAVMLVVFFVILLFGYSADKALDKGEMRRAIAGAFVIGFFILTIMCLYRNDLQKEVVLVFINSVGIVIGFYFGSKAVAHKESESKDQIDIENINFINDKKAKITLRNKVSNTIKVDKIYIDDESFEEENVIPSKKSKEIELNLSKELKPDNVYKVKAVTSNGVPTETSKTFKK